MVTDGALVSSIGSLGPSPCRHKEGLVALMGLGKRCYQCVHVPKGVTLKQAIPTNWYVYKGQDGWRRDPWDSQGSFPSRQHC